MRQPSLLYRSAAPPLRTILRWLLAVLVMSSLVPGSATPIQAQAPLPNSLAAVGDSLTRAVGSGQRYFADNTANSWATGGNPDINYFHLSAHGQARLAETAWAASGFGP